MCPHQWCRSSPCLRSNNGQLSAAQLWQGFPRAPLFSLQVQREQWNEMLQLKARFLNCLQTKTLKNRWICVVLMCWHTWQVGQPGQFAGIPTVMPHEAKTIEAFVRPKDGCAQRSLVEKQRLRIKLVQSWSLFGAIDI